MRDVQRRLGAAGFAPADAEIGHFCRSTVEAVRNFQRNRGLRPTGAVDDPTWAALVEASWRLGDRLLFHTSPYLRGDDVASLQAKLAHLGFDCGKIDGIFGPLAARALERFQRNCGLHADGVCGPETVAFLERVGRQSGSGPGIAALREHEQWRASGGTLTALRVVIAHDGGFGTVTRGVARHLRAAGASVVPLDDPDILVQAHTANQFGAAVFIGFHASEEPTARAIYYAVPAFSSVPGRALAEQLAAALTSRKVAATVDVVGERLPVLRETKMPAVWCELGPVGLTVTQAVAVADACGDALRAWVARPIR